MKKPPKPKKKKKTKQNPYYASDLQSDP